MKHKTHEHKNTWKNLKEKTIGEKTATTKHSWTVTTSAAVPDVTAVSMGGKGVGFFHSNSLWTLDCKLILAMCSKVHVFSEATTGVAQIYMVLYQWGRREQALHEEIHLQMCRTFTHLTSISSNGMVACSSSTHEAHTKQQHFSCPLL